MRFAKVLAFFLVASTMWSCNKNEASESPEINFVKQSSTMVADSGIGEDFILFQFDFEDGYADIGPVDDPISWQNIHFIDNRTNSESYYDFPPIPSSVVKKDGISGTFIVTMDPTTIIARQDTTFHKLTDTVSWSVFVIDDAGNLSNEVQTLPIVIKKQ